MKRTYNSQPTHKTKQQGVTLVVALIFLLALSMLGVWGATGNALQERMAGNTRNRDLAFQAAEAALADAEATIEGWRKFATDGSKGLYKYQAVNSTNTVTPSQANDASFWMNSENWVRYREVSAVTLEQVAEPPRYIIEKMETKNGVEYYRVTARGVGGDSNAVVILQSIITYRS